jgi:hypothetical protein
LVRESVSAIEKVGLRGIGVDGEEVVMNEDGLRMVEVDHAVSADGRGGKEREGCGVVGFVGHVECPVMVPCVNNKVSNALMRTVNMGRGLSSRTLSIPPGTEGLRTSDHNLHFMRKLSDPF